MYDQLSKKSQYIGGQLMLEQFLHFDAEKELRILDMGCGTGDLARVMAKKYRNSKIDACDPCQERIEVAKQNNSAPQISYFNCDAQSFLRTKQNHYDVIYSNAVLHWIKEKGSLFIAINNALRQNGISFHSTIYKDLNESPFIHILGEEEMKIFAQSLPFATIDQMKDLVREAGLETYFVEQKVGNNRNLTWEQFLDLFETLKDLTNVSIKQRFQDHPDHEFVKEKFDVTRDGFVGMEMARLKIAFRKIS